jgi:hypothetical protein
MDNTFSSGTVIRMVPIAEVGAIKESIQRLGHRVRIRYRGPHGRNQDTLKADARAASIYIL